MAPFLNEDDYTAALTLLELSRDDGNRPRKEVPIEEEVPSTPLLQQENQAPPQNLSPKRKAGTEKPKQSKKRKVMEEDNSEETRGMLLEEYGNKVKLDPREIFGDGDVAEEGFSKPIKKQLTESDVKQDQSRLMLGKMQVKKKMFPLLKESEIPCGTNGLDVSVYGPDGEVQAMKFKMWNTDTPVLTSGWKEFVAVYGLKMHSDFLTIWMFRHKETRKICLAIDIIRFPSIKKPLSKKILEAVISNPNYGFFVV